MRNVKSQVLPLAATGKRNQASYHFLLLDCRRIRKETHVLLRHIKIYHVGCTVIRNLTQEHCQLRYFDVSTKTFFALHRSCHVQLIICRFLCEYGCPRIETANPLPFKLLRTQILEHHIKFGQCIYHHCTRQKRSPKVTTCTKLDVTNGEQEVHCPLRAFGVADTCHTVMACLEH